MAIEIEVAPEFGVSHQAGFLHASVVVRFDGPIETMTVTVLFADQNDRAKNEAQAIAMAKQLALRFAYQNADAPKPAIPGLNDASIFEKLSGEPPRKI